jgi:hypothetical protein
LSLEPLESRTLLTGFSGPLALEVEPNDTIERAQDLGDLNAGRQRAVSGTIGRGGSGAADVDWYRFSLDRPSVITVATLSGQMPRPLVSMLSLYGSTTQNSTGLRNHPGYRLLGQSDGTDAGGDARLDRALAAGTYFVAVSGSGNRYFHPLIAGSGFPGSTGDYELLATANDLKVLSTDGPAVLAADPAAGADLASSPFVIRIDFSTTLDPASIVRGNTVHLSYSPGASSDTSQQAVLLASWYFDATADELQLMPAAPLRPGSYQLFLAGNRVASRPVLTDLAGNPLGENDFHPLGADITIPFRISGVKGNRAANAGADDTPATAQDLGELIGAGLVHLPGALGDDPTDPVPYDSADVDLYHFHIQGSGRYAFTAEVFAGRIGSPLDPALSLFRLDASDQQLHLVASNDNSLNPTVTHDGSSAPLFTDPVVYAGLTEGDFYLAVSSSPNVPMPAFGRLPGTAGVFDPNVPHSGKIGSSIGNYVLNVAAETMNDPPYVSSMPAIDGTPLYDGAILTDPPTTLSLTFDKTVNLRQMISLTGSYKLNAVYIQDSQGAKYFPYLINYRQGENRADFLMYDALPDGFYELHLSGRLGLADLAGNPLVGNDPSGDYVVRFAVRGPARGSNGDARVWLADKPHSDPAHPQDVGVLFPAELQIGVLLERTSPLADPADLSDYYRFRVLQKGLYSFLLHSSTDLPGIRLTLADVSGNPISLAGGPFHVPIGLDAGTYTVGIVSASPAWATNPLYQLSITAAGGTETAPALSIGPGPAIRIRPSTGGPPAVLSAVASASSTVATQPVPGGGPNVGAIPSSLFLLMAAGPVGSSGSSDIRRSDVHENLLAHPANLLLSEIVTPLPLLIGIQHSGTQQNTPESGELAQWLETLMQRFGNFSWSQALEFFFGSHEGPENVPVPPSDGWADDLSEINRLDDPPEGARSAAWDAFSRGENWEHSVSLAWVVAVALVAGTPSDHGRRRWLRRVRRVPEHEFTP